MDDPFQPNAIEGEKLVAPPPSARLIQKHSTKPGEDVRSRELKAMEDLISALDDQALDKKAPPSAYDLKIDPSSKHEKSRLSMGEDLVTPGGHSIREDAV